MTFQPKDAKKAIEAIKRGESKDGWGKGELGDVLSVVKKRKDPDFDRTSIGAQLRYTGRQREIIKDALKVAFPETTSDIETGGDGSTLMPVVGINSLKMLARLDAGVLVSPPDIFLEDDKGVRLPAESDASKLWVWALRKSRCHVKLAEAERRALITPGCSIGVVNYRFGPGDKIGKPQIDLYFPHDVEVLCHWEAPVSWEHRFIVTIRQAAPDTDSKGEWYLVLYRVPPAEIDGAWGKWRRVLVSTEGEVAAPPDDLPGDLCPVFLVQLTDAQGHPFVFEDPDLLDAIDDLSVRRSNESYVINLQGHDQLWTDDLTEGQKLRGGPDAILPVDTGATVGLLSPNPKLREMRESRDQAQRELATSRGNSPHAYVQKASGNPPTGIAMKIENLAHDTRVAEQATIMQVIIEDEMLPILLDVMIAHHPNGKRLLNGLVPRMVPRMQPALEEPTQKQTRLLQAFKEKLIPRERVGADMDYYPSIEVAKSEIEAIEKAAPSLTIAPTIGADKKDEVLPKPPKNEGADDLDKEDEDKPADKSTADVGLNELTLGIERLGRIGDVDSVNVLRRALADALGVSYDGDLSQNDLPAP